MDRPNPVMNLLLPLVFMVVVTVALLAVASDNVIVIVALVVGWVIFVGSVLRTRAAR